VTQARGGGRARVHFGLVLGLALPTMALAAIGVIRLCWDAGPGGALCGRLPPLLLPGFGLLGLAELAGVPARPVAVAAFLAVLGFGVGAVLGALFARPGAGRLARALGLALVLVPALGALVHSLALAAVWLERGGALR
jgi:hypothetical protein